jgi:hypothetical protein
MRSFLHLLVGLSLYSTSAQVYEDFYSENFEDQSMTGWANTGDVRVAQLGGTNYVLETSRVATAVKTLDSKDFAGVVISFNYGTEGLENNDRCTWSISIDGGTTFVELLNIEQVGGSISDSFF